DVEAVLAGDPEELARIDLRTPIRVLEDLRMRASEVYAIGIQRGAERAAGVARSGRHVEIVEARFPQDARVGHSVERHAPAVTEVGQSGLALERSGEIEEGLFEDRLHAGGDVGEARAFGGREIDRIPGIPRRTERVAELRRIAPLGALVKIEIREV